MKVGTPTVDQLQILATVVECGSFAGAGRRLTRATSAIAYGIDNLEEQLGVAVFDRSGTKKPELTEAGRALLAHARSVLQGVEKMRAKAASLREGEEAEVSLVTDVMLPTARSPCRIPAVIEMTSCSNRARLGKIDGRSPLVEKKER